MDSDLLNSLIVSGWDKIKEIDEEIKNLKENNYNDIAELMQGVYDAYLIYVGQLEGYKTGTTKAVQVEDKIGPQIEPQIELHLEPQSKELKTTKTPVVYDYDQPTFSLKDSDNKIEDQPVELSGEEFEFCCDFDEPDLSEPKLTDQDLYNN